MTRQCERISCNKPAETELINERGFSFWFCSGCAQSKMDEYDDLEVRDDGV